MAITHPALFFLPDIQNAPRQNTHPRCGRTRFALRRLLRLCKRRDKLRGIPVDVTQREERNGYAMELASSEDATSSA